jgi:outer membrane protein TolC
MKLKYILITFFFPTLISAQQGFDAFLQSVESNNKTLISAQKLSEAESLEAKTGIYLANPEVSYARLNQESGFYSEMVVSQSFDFPSTYIHKNKIAEITAQKSVAKYNQLRNNVFTEAAEIYGQFIAVNRKLVLLYKMQEMMTKLSANAAKRLEVGEINIFEFNRIRNETATANTKLKILKAERNTLKLKTSELNGGLVYEITDTVISGFSEPILTDTVVAEIVSKHPFSNYWENELEISERNISLQKASSLPKFELGYRQDANASYANHGFVAGLSIPLFENKNSVRLAKAQHNYLLEEVNAEQLKLENSISQMIQSYEIMNASVKELENIVESLNTPELLLKSYEAGQMNYTEFFTEYNNFRDSILYIEELNKKVTILRLKINVLLKI